MANNDPRSHAAEAPLVVPEGQWAVEVRGGGDDYKTMFVSGVQSFTLAEYPSDGGEEARGACEWFATQFRTAMRKLGAPPERAAPRPSTTKREAVADCKACQTRKRRGFDGPCPACGAEMTRAELAAERAADSSSASDRKRLADLEARGTADRLEHAFEIALYQTREAETGFTLDRYRSALRTIADDDDGVSECLRCHVSQRSADAHEKDCPVVIALAALGSGQSGGGT